MEGINGGLFTGIQRKQGACCVLYRITVVRFGDFTSLHTPSCPFGLIRHTEVLFSVSVFISMTSTIIPISSWMIAYCLRVVVDIPSRQGLTIFPPSSICPFLLKEHCPPFMTTTSLRIGMVSWLAYAFIATRPPPMKAASAT